MAISATRAMIAKTRDRVRRKRGGSTSYIRFAKCCQGHSDPKHLSESMRRQTEALPARCRAADLELEKETTPLGIGMCSHLNTVSVPSKRSATLHPLKAFSGAIVRPGIA